MSTMLDETTRRTEAVFERRMEVAMKMFAGEASYDDVLAFHADDFIWMSPAGVVQGHEEARRHQARRMERMPPGAMDGLRILRHEVVGEYVYLAFKTDMIPFGTDTFVIHDGKVVFQSNGVCVPRALRERMR